MSDNMTEGFARITIDQMHGEAFTDTGGDQSAAFQLRHLASILQRLAHKLEDASQVEMGRTLADLYTEEGEDGHEYREGTLDLPLRDINGNVVGRALIGITERPD